MLDSRLKMCAEAVSGEGVACDVGTDHAYLASELILSGKCNHVIASDVAEKPLEFARNTVEKYNISDKVDLILSDGLKEVPSDNVTDVVIAGMGAETIIHILEDVEWIKKGVRLILQPMTKSPLLRKWLYANGYKITEEKAVRDGKFIYTVITSEYCGDTVKLTEFASIIGHLDFSFDISKEYLEYQINKLDKIAEGLENSRNIEESLKVKKVRRTLAIILDFDTLTGEEIYNVLNEFYPFSTQEKWDNSGYLVGNKGKLVRKILLSLDITKSAILEAKNQECEMIISHHPVIFEPLKNINSDSVVFKLIRDNISAICMHTNLDIAEDGTNGVIIHKLAEEYDFSCEPFEELGNGLSLGMICTLEERASALIFGIVLKEIFNCEVVRCSNTENSVKRFAVCSGSGGSMLDLAIAKGCDTLITGDIKHDVWISANNQNFTLFDCGHFNTENLVLEHLKNVLEANFPFIETTIAKTSTDPVNYII